MPSLVGFWPLNQHYKGKNLATQDVDFELINVEFVHDDGVWKSSPASFQKYEDSYARVSSTERIPITMAFSWIGAVYRMPTADTGEGILFEFAGENAQSTHFAIVSDTFHVNLRRAACNNWYSMTHRSRIGFQKWYELAVSFDALNNTLSMYVDGRREDLALPPCPYGVVDCENIFINNRYA
jgi:hypothetical protein